MTIHVVCMDGTRQWKKQAHPTNVAKIFDALGGPAHEAKEGSWEMAVPDVVTGKYIPGVGAPGSETLMILGNLLGAGLGQLIVRGYTYLSRAWQPGDQIVLTGFSRGAAGARALAGLIVARGLLDPTKYDTTDSHEAYARGIAAWAVYRKVDKSLVNQGVLAAMALALGRKQPHLTNADFRPPTAIRAVAAFDTVSSLSVPQIGDGGHASFKFTIFDTALSPMVEHGFHALAADETRDVFAPTFWDDRANVDQQIFPGCHSNVGGGFVDVGLSDGALAWMLDRLEFVGVPLHRNLISIKNNADDFIQDDAHGFHLVDGLGCSPRQFPAAATPHASLKARLRTPNKVKPGGVDPYLPAGRYNRDRLIFP